MTELSSGAPTRTVEPRRRHARSSAGNTRWTWWVLAVLGLIGLVAILDAAAVHALDPNSDAASLVLEGQSVTNGHVLLHGWALSLDSFWTSEVPFYTVAFLVVGMHGVLLSLVPAVLAGLVVAAGVVIAAEGRRPAAAAAGAITVLAMLAIPNHALASFLLLGGSHEGAMLWSLLAFYVLRRPRWGAGVWLAGVFLAAGMLGDLETLAYGTGPIFAAGLVTALRRRSWRAGRPQMAAAVIGGAITVVVGLVAQLIGSFSIGSANPISRPHQALENVRHLYSIGGEMLGSKSAVFGTGGVPGPLQDVHVVGAVVVVVAAALALVRMVVGAVKGRDVEPPVDGARRPSWWGSEPWSWPLDDMLVLAAIGVALSYVVLSSFQSVEFARYLTGTIVFLCILAGRVVAREWANFRPAPLRRAAGALGLAVVVCFSAGFVYTVTTAGPTRPAADLGNWLEAHHLTSGVGAYWSSSIVTVLSDDHVKVRPVIANPAGRVVRYQRESTADWYKGQTFTFLVFMPGAPWGNVSTVTATATFGAPAHTYMADGFEILVWSHPFRVAPTGGFGN